MVPMNNTTLVLGGTGKTGRRVAERLWALDRPVRVGSRRGTPPFDWDDRSTWAGALRDVGSVYIAYYPDLAFPGAAEAIGAFSRAAVASGVRRLVLLSGREAQALPSEEAVRTAGVESTVIRASWFAQNFSEHFLLEAVRAGVIALPAGDVAEPFIDVDDIADIAVAALTEDGHAGELYEVTGPRLLTFADVAAELTLATGREVRYLAVSPAGVPDPRRRAGRAGRRGGRAHRALRTRPRRAQRPADRRRSTGPGPTGARLRRLRTRCRGVGCVGCARRRGRPMRTGLAGPFTVVAATGAGVVGGVFFAFSTFVMRALRGLPDRDGLVAMQAINKAAPSPLFLTALLGTGVVTVGLAISAATRLDEPGAPYQLAGSALYLTAVALTIVYHVPKNEALALVTPGGADAVGLWRHYARSWTAWNHVRTLTSIAGAATLVLALRCQS